MLRENTKHDTFGHQQSSKIKPRSIVGEAIGEEPSQDENILLFTTDSELDTFFKENEMLIKKSKTNSFSESSVNKFDNLDDFDFDQMVTTAQR
jgi:hypothetical protein